MIHIHQTTSITPIKRGLFLLTTMFFSVLAFGQASTVGKDFWVSSTIVCSPGGSGKKATPYIAISAEKACTVKIQGGLNNAINITQQVAAGSWNQFGDQNAITTDGQTLNNNPLVGPVNVAMNTADWYPVAASDASNVRSYAGQINNYGLHITATDEISVYVILSSENSMDASNILPMNAIQSEYYTQDYSPIVKSDFSNTISMVTILATENNTTVDIIPNGATYDNHASGVPYNITLQKGQTYYMMSAANQQIGGSHIQARNGRKIAVFCGIPLTNIPSNIAARDGCFEQVMPIDYWGNQFVVTRSLWKNGNLIGITALEDGTEIKIDGNTINYINAGETYYVMLQSAINLPHAKNPGTGPVNLVTAGDAAYIETSCPCAIFSYDTGNSYAGNTGNEIQNSKGDPSSVWVSPLQQKINTITFGTCYTGKTKDHFLNVIAETSTCQQTTLTAINGATSIDKTSTLIWIPVPGNPAYSYARVQIGTEASKAYKVFKLQNSRGFIANIYGNGEDESYAYSAGSAAVKRGVMVEGETYIDGYMGQTTYCVNVPVNFDAQVGTDVIDKVDWDFGDGVSEDDGSPQFTHVYDVPGWYDVVANVYAHKECPLTQYPAEQVHFSFRVLRPDTVRQSLHECMPADYTGPMVESDTVRDECIAVYINTIEHGKATSYEYDYVARDSCWLSDGQMHYASGSYTWTLPNANSQGCDSIITCHLRVITCLEMDIPNVTTNQHVCPGDPYDIPFNYYKGDIGESHFICGSIDQVVYPSTSSNLIALPTESLQPGNYQATITVQDTICDQTLRFPLNLQVYYPKNIFNYKFGNVLAVYTTNFNGGYQFVGYQWYKNGMPIEGAISSIYHTEEMFTVGDVYYVMLTRSDGVVLPSCSQTIEYIPQYSTERMDAAPQKMINNQRFYIMKDGQLYDLCGQKIGRQ